MDKMSTVPLIGAVSRGVTDVKFSRPLPSSSFTIENLIAVKRRRSVASDSSDQPQFTGDRETSLSPVIDPVERGVDSPQPFPSGGSLSLTEASTPQQQHQQQYLAAAAAAAAAAAGYSAAMLSFGSFPPLYHPWAPAGRYLSQAANEKLSSFLFHHSNGANHKLHSSESSSFPSIDSQPSPAVPPVPPPSHGMPSPSSAGDGRVSPRARSGDKFHLQANDAGLLSKVYAAAAYQHQHHQQPRYLGASSPGVPFPGSLEPNLPHPPLAHIAQHRMLPDEAPYGTPFDGSRGGGSDSTPTAGPPGGPLVEGGDGADEDGGDSADGSAYSDDISLSLSPAGCGKSAGKFAKVPTINDSRSSTTLQDSPVVEWTRG
ncbi:AGAP006923-PA-like protein [Anopheles sinensis]|uniref:AGAP006923-PA-like protein n=1 Tax=Anopheles sinensis TaxID=74873 RepID=A0A084WKP8_ANOSI|nr:AGAP006923-PA-like protein [Anopheles sinensis]